MKKVDVLSLNLQSFDIFGNQWALLTAGDGLKNYNTMTIGWGGLGTLWGTPSATVYVRTNRYTFDYIDKSEYYTIAFFDKKYKKALGFCGSKSGRDYDKAKETGLTPIEVDGTVSFKEAKLVLVVRKQYAEMMKPESFIDKAALEKYYDEETNPFHKIYIGEVVAAYVGE